MKFVKTILFSLFGLVMINGGLSKFFNYMPSPKDLPEAMARDMTAFTEIAWLMPLIAIAELIAGILILIPRTRALGALVILPVMTGILLTRITVAPEGLPIALLLWAILIWMMVDNKHKLLPIINK